MKSANFLFAIIAAIGICPGARADNHKSVDLAGVWNVMASTDEGVREITWTIKKEGDKYTGTSLDQESGDERTLDRISVKETQVTVEIDLEIDGNTGVIKVIAEEKKQGRLTGEWSIVGEDGNEFMSGDMTARKEVSFAGDWATKAILPSGDTLESVLHLKGKNTALKGVIAGDSRETEIDKVAANDDGLRMEFDFEMDGNTINCVIKAEAKGSDKLVGKWVVIGDGGEEAAEGEWTAERKSRSLAGTWNVVATVPDSDDYKGTLILTEEDGKYSGKSKGANSDARALQMISVEEKELEFSVPFERDGVEGKITVVAKQKEDGSLEGEWILVGSDGNEFARDSWKATRE